METPDLDTMLNIVNVMAYSHQNGKKFAVHCHAGLGRTGLSIACYLVYSKQFTAMDAILLVRAKRPLSVQTKKQSLFVSRFEARMKHLRLIFPGMISKTQKDQVPCDLISFSTAISNQKWWLHMEEVPYLRNIPKVILFLTRLYLNYLIELLLYA